MNLNKMQKSYSLDIDQNELKDVNSLTLNIELNVNKGSKYPTSDELFDSKFNWTGIGPLDLESDRLMQVDWLKYYTEVYQKNQVVLHHTVSGPGIEGDLAHLKTFDSHIAICIIISRDGTINQLFSSKYWGYHLGCGNTFLDQHSIAVELDNWGQLYEKDGKFYNVYDKVVDVPVRKYLKGFRGEQIFEAYTKEQIWSLGELLLLWSQNYDIPLRYNEDMWDVSDRALNGESGIWSHVSFRPKGKWDAHPDPMLISLLKYLEKNT